MLTFEKIKESRERRRYAVVSNSNARVIVLPFSSRSFLTANISTYLAERLSKEVIETDRMLEIAKKYGLVEDNKVRFSLLWTVEQIADFWLPDSTKLWKEIGRNFIRELNLSLARNKIKNSIEVLLNLTTTVVVLKNVSIPEAYFVPHLKKLEEFAKYYLDESCVKLVRETEKEILKRSEDKQFFLPRRTIKAGELTEQLDESFVQGLWGGASSIIKPALPEHKEEAKLYAKTFSTIIEEYRERLLDMFSNERAIKTLETFLENGEIQRNGDARALKEYLHLEFLLSDNPKHELIREFHDKGFKNMESEKIYATGGRYGVIGGILPYTEFTLSWTEVMVGLLSIGVQPDTQTVSVALHILPAFAWEGYNEKGAKIVAKATLETLEVERKENEHPQVYVYVPKRAERLCWSCDVIERVQVKGDLRRYNRIANTKYRVLNKARVSELVKGTLKLHFTSADSFLAFLSDSKAFKKAIGEQIMMLYGPDMGL